MAEGRLKGGCRQDCLPHKIEQRCQPARTITAGGAGIDPYGGWRGGAIVIVYPLYVVV